MKKISSIDWHAKKGAYMHAFGIEWNGNHEGMKGRKEGRKQPRMRR